MSWVKIDDQFFTHPKVLAAGKDGRALFIAGLCYSASHLTDGLVPTAALPMVAATAEVSRKSATKKLVEVGLWHEVPEGWCIHDYHDHQPHAEDVKARRDEVSRTRSEAGKRGAAARWGDGKPDGKPDGKRNGKAVANEKQTPGKAIAPSPSPSPYPSSSPPTAPTTAPPDVAGVGAPTEEDRPRTPRATALAAIDHIAQCDLRHAEEAGTIIRDRAAWLKTARASRTTGLLDQLLAMAEHQAGTDPVDLAEQLDGSFGPLDGGTARAAKAWAAEQARQAADEAVRAQARAEMAEVRKLLEDPELHARLVAQVEAEHPGVGAGMTKALVITAAARHLEETTAP